MARLWDFISVAKGQLSPVSEIRFSSTLLELCFVCPLFSVLVCAFIFVLYFKFAFEFMARQNHL